MKRLLCTLALLLLSTPAWAAVAFDTQAESHTFNVSSKATNITIGSLSNGVIVVEVGLGDTTQTVSSVTGAGATWPGAATCTYNNASNQRFEIWRGLTPSSGAQTVTVTLSGTQANDVVVQLWTYGGVDQTTPVSDCANDTTGTIAITTASGDGAVVMSAKVSALVSVSNCTSSFDLSPVNVWNWFWSTAHCAASGASTTFTFNAAAGSLGARVNQSSTTVNTSQFRLRMQW